MGTEHRLCPGQFSPGPSRKSDPRARWATSAMRGPSLADALRHATGLSALDVVTLLNARMERLCR